MDSQNSEKEARASEAIWAIGEGFRIDPITGRVREHQRLDGDPLPADFDYQKTNLIWDSAKKQINLFAARNEVVACQLAIPGPASGVRVECSDLKGPGAIDGAVDVEILKQWYLNVEQNSSKKDSTTAGWNMGPGWYADGLVPVEGSGDYGQPFDIPDRKNGIGDQRWQGVWIDIYIPRDAPAGTYDGTVTISADQFEESFALGIEVYGVTLGDDYACEVGLNNYGSLAKKGSEVRLRYYQMAHRHRMAVHEHYIQPGVTGSGESMTGEWVDYDAEMGKYLSGEAFTKACGYRGPGEGRPLRWIYLPFEILKGYAWPMSPEEKHTPEYDQAVAAMLRDFQRHFDQKGWTKTDLMCFINGLDEPTTLEQAEEIRYFGELTRDAAADRVHYRADINHLHDIDSFDFGWTEQTMLDELGSVIDLWVCVGDFQRTDFSVLLPRKAPPNNEVVWFYQNREPSVGGYTLDDETIGLRTWPVIAWKYGIDGCVLWELGFVGQSKDTWIDPRNSVYEDVVHNLAGFVIYPSREEVTGPVASIRLKSFRRGAQDYEYLRLLTEVADRATADALLDPILPTGLHVPERAYGDPGTWSHNPEDWERMRRAILEEIVRHQ
jgi:hypothetical protein